MTIIQKLTIFSQNVCVSFFEIVDDLFSVNTLDIEEGKIGFATVLCSAGWSENVAATVLLLVH